MVLKADESLGHHQVAALEVEGSSGPCHNQQGRDHR